MLEWLQLSGMYHIYYLYLKEMAKGYFSNTLIKHTPETYRARKFLTKEGLVVYVLFIEASNIVKASVW